MTNKPPAATTPDAVPADAPLSNFTDCHAGILKQLRELDELPALLGSATRARRIAMEALSFFREAVFEHHVDEERLLFPAALASAEPGREREEVQARTERLTREHRSLEKAWKSLEKPIKLIAQGKDAELDAQALYRLVESYAAHAAFEETEFLPMAERILSRNSNHMAALGLTLHMKQVPVPSSYI